MSYRNKLARLRTFLPAAALGVCLIAGCGDGQEASPAGAEDAPPAEVSPAPSAPRDGRGVEAQLADATIAAEVRKALAADDSLRRFDFEPEVAAGQVTLRGVVETSEEQARAAEVARGVADVRGVVNEVTLAADTSATVPEG